MEDDKKSKRWILVVIIALIALVAIAASGMINITVLDPQPFTNLTIQVNLT